MRNRYETFTVLMSKITRDIRRLKADAMREFKLKVPHFSCIYYLYTAGALTAKELCDKCDEDKSGVSRSLDFLEKDGYIVCDVTAGKRYKSLLRLTEKGKAIGEIINNRIKEVIDKASLGLSEAEIVSLYRWLVIISDNLKKLGD